jgi:CheY-like chemotaxis protein
MKKKILIVDDQPQISRILVDILTRANYQVELATNGQIAVDKTIEMKPDLIIMDVMMPVMTGYDAVKKIREIPEIAATAVIFLTAKGLETDNEEAKKLGALALVSKPFSPRAVLLLVEEKIGK